MRRCLGGFPGDGGSCVPLSDKHDPKRQRWHSSPMRPHADRRDGAGGHQVAAQLCARSNDAAVRDQAHMP